MTELQADEIIRLLKVLVSLGYVIVFIVALSLALNFFRRGGH